MKEILYYIDFYEFIKDIKKLNIFSIKELFLFFNLFFKILFYSFRLIFLMDLGVIMRNI
jgi:hypothetical protein